MTKSGAQPSIECVLQGKDVKEKLDIAFAKLMYDCFITVNVVTKDPTFIIYVVIY